MILRGQEIDWLFLYESVECWQLEIKKHATTFLLTIVGFDEYELFTEHGHSYDDF